MTGGQCDAGHMGATADDEVNLVDIGQRLTAARVAAGLDLETLAYLSRTKYAALRSYERGERKANVFAAIRIAKVLKRTVEELFDPDLEPKRRGVSR